MLGSDLCVGFFVGTEATRAGRCKRRMVEAERVTDEDAGVEVGRFKARVMQLPGEIASHLRDGARIDSRDIGVKHQLTSSAASNSA